ncbi:hydantoinase/oxoprolinase family protein [Desulfohalovibrio reitneri]|uniref:hydantoinase/oxoprolinase family protein n=1 Tax=Desulfohalovibrio reitneri TaxID=1307759 RepID=UPI0004A71BE8|nr:hydantoinase/oxoprolinase family protein [Desulfohalovibrio reitneri]
MLLGIDVGGTHTDAVAVGFDGVLATAKAVTDHENLLSSVFAVLEKLGERVDLREAERLNLSTTLTTNAIVEGTIEDVGVLVCGGPGIDPGNYRMCRDYHVLSGATDHRGTSLKDLDPGELRQAAESCRENGVLTYACVSKFSPRNPKFERRMAEAVEGQADMVTMGHEMGGRLNFPRRIATAYFNAASWRRFNEFAFAVTRGLEDKGVRCMVNILKADGGTMPLATARKRPVESILSGPAASVMGLVSMCDIALDSIILDIGGTTTDIAVFAQGAPLMENDGIDIGSYPTLVRALMTRSIGVGGDSAISVLGEEVRVGPRRVGPCMCAGGRQPALMDAFNYLARKTGDDTHGDVEASVRGIEEFASERSIPAETLAQKAVDAAVARIEQAAREMVAEINDRPVYTIHELIDGARIVPKKVYVVGGPAKAFRMPLFRAFELSVEVPRHFAVANAVGSALTRTTDEVEVFADTEKLRMYVPSLGVSKAVEPRYGLEDAKRDARRALLKHLREQGIPVREENLQITHASSFAMVDGMRRVGDTIRVAAQIKPGILHRYKNLRGKLC